MMEERVPKGLECREAVLFIDAGVLKDALQAEFPDASFVEGTKEQIYRLTVCPPKVYRCEIPELFVWHCMLKDYPT